MKNFLYRLGLSVLFIINVPILVYAFVGGIIAFCLVQGADMAWLWMEMIKDIIISDIEFIRTLDFNNFKENLILSFNVLNVEEES